VSTVRPRQLGLKIGETVLIRTASPQDALSLLEVRRSVVEEGQYTLTEPDEFTTTAGDVRQAIEEHLEKPGCLYLVAGLGRRVVGLLRFSNGRHRRTAHAGTLMVLVQAGHRDKGIGTALLQSLIDWATENPLIEKLTLAVFSTNHRAIALYRKLGFQEEGRCPRDMKLADGTYIDSVLMYRFVK
jgi:RimJ/RimL family protein N-acetyltransferase